MTSDNQETVARIRAWYERENEDATTTTSAADAFEHIGALLDVLARLMPSEGQPEHVTAEELAEIERLDREATPIEHWGHAIAPMTTDSGCSKADTAMAYRARKLLPRLAAELRALRAPVDVEGDTSKLVRALVETRLWDALDDEDPVTPLVRPLVERAARLARENTALQERVVRMTRAASTIIEQELREELDAARAELAKVVLERDAMAERLREGRAEIEWLMAQLAAAREPDDGMGALG